jgi:hypothetical protein
VESELVAYARACGWFMEQIGEPVDFIGTHLGMHWPVEIKSATGKFTKQQVDYMRDCGGKVLVWRHTRDIDHDTRLIRTMAEFIHSANH